MNIRNSMIVAAGICLIFGAASPVRSATSDSIATEDSAALDQRIINAMAGWQVPGLAIVVVRDGKTVLMKGYGTRQHGSAQEIDAETYLQIASNSKAFAAYTIGILVDDGKLNWDDSVKKHIPEFSLPDPFVEENISIDDLLSHRSGLTEVALGGFQNIDYTIDDLLRDLETEPLSVRFRARNNYSQVGMALLGEIVERVSGMTWGNFVRERIFEPIGMDSSYTSTADFENRVGILAGVQNIMMPAVLTNGQVANRSWEHIGTTPLYAPAGGIISNLVDMSTWIQFRLNNGVIGGEKLISANSLEEIRAPRIPADFEVMGMPWTYFHPSAQLVDVGYGHYSFEHHGRKAIIHNGGWMTSVVAIMPDSNIGVGIFSNAWFDEPAPWSSLAFVNALALDVFDHYLEHPHENWTGRMKAIVADRASAAPDTEATNLSNHQ
jgi:CubicO group peptidase (beta-lactamase class C family)